MTFKIQTPSGHAIPPGQRHAITVHLPLWNNLVRWVDGDPEISSSLKSMYPRMMLHRDVKELVQKVLDKSGTPDGQSCLLFSNPESAAKCKDFALSEARGEDRPSPEDVSVRIFDSCVRLYGVFFPAKKRSSIQPFWTHTGTGISSRLAESCLQLVDVLREVHDDRRLGVEECEAHCKVRERIAGLLTRSPVTTHNAQLSPDDVYLFPTGMAAIYTLHDMILKKNNGLTVLFGFPFRSTCFLFENFGPGCKLLGLGNAKELVELEELLHANTSAGRTGRVQAVWTEIPANPMLTTADLKALRGLADKYNFALIVDDTVGSFCNVDVLSVADVLITSLTKSFSGYADVMGGSLVLNTSSARYSEFKTMFKDAFYNDYWKEDAEVLERNSRDYLPRSKTLNDNAKDLVSFLHAYVTSTKSSLQQIYYPTVNPDRENYEAFMRPSTSEFTPGYGCLFAMEFETTEAAIAFYDNLEAYNGPHLGAHLTLAMAYVKGLYSKQLNWAAQYGLKESQIRISVGLEKIEVLVGAFEIAMRAADATRNLSEGTTLQALPSRTP